MSITYTYEIIAIDEAARCMEVVYSAEGRQTMHIGARLPYEGESLEAIIEMYSPVRFWEEREAVVVPPEVGAAGTVAPPEPPPVTLESAKEQKRGEIAQWRYTKETRGVSLDGVLVKTDRESQAAINRAYSAMKDGLITSVDWKAADGGFVVLGLSEITAIAQAVAAHVQGCFTKEKTLVEQVNEAATIAEVQAIDPSTIFPESFGSIPSAQV